MSFDIKKDKAFKKFFKDEEIEKNISYFDFICTRKVQKKNFMNGDGSYLASKFFIFIKTKKSYRIQEK